MGNQTAKKCYKIEIETITERAPSEGCSVMRVEIPSGKA